MNLDHLINNAQHIPNIPQVIQELIQSFGDENITGNDIANTLNKDQALTAKVLRVANSSRYAGSRNVGSINSAVVLLGFNNLRTIVLASGLASALPTPEGFDSDKFWKKSFSVGSLSRWLAKQTSDIDPEIAFTCGMLHDIGGLLMHILTPEDAQRIDKDISDGTDRTELEEQYLGFNYTDAGAELANRWHFPKEIVDAIQHQCQPPENNQQNPLAIIVYIANYLYQYQGEDRETILSRFPITHAEAAQINVTEVTSATKEIESLLAEEITALQA